MTGRPWASTRTGARIDATGWGYRYPGRPTAALADVSFDVAPGELVVLMGASGSGKSTLLAALAGILPGEGETGTLRVSGDDPASPARIGLVQQEPEGNVVMELVGDDVAFPLENVAAPPEGIWPRVRAALAEVGLAVPLDRPTNQLSGGQTQLLAVAAAAVAAPDLLLLDEPTANLDAESAAAVLRAVDRVRASTGCTVVVVEHRVAPWLLRADKVLVMSRRCLIALAPEDLAGHLAARPDLAARLWLDTRALPDLGPADAFPGVPELEARTVGVAGRLAPTDVTVRSGEVVAIVGRPGSGKTTLLWCLAGLLRPTQGQVQVGSDGRSEPWTWPAAEVAATFGVVFQDPEHQFVTGRVTDELAHGLGSVGVAPSEVRNRVAAMLDRLHLTDLADADPFTLSGGEQRRLSVGTALVRDPGILLLDEPTFGQDPATWTEIVRIIAAHRDAGGAVVVATHDSELVRCLGAREVRLTPVADGPASAAPGVAAPPTSAAFPLDSAGPPDAIQVAGGLASSDLDEVADRRLGRGSDRAGHRMQFASSGSVGRAGRLGRLDPLALLGSAVLLCLAALLSSSVAVNLGLAGFALLAALIGDLPVRRIGLLALPALLATFSVGFSNALLSSAGPFHAEVWQAAALPASRVLAVALPGLVAAVALDPTALADSLVVRLRVPARAAYAALAGLRLLPLLADEWNTLARANRARGLGGSGPAARIRQFVSTTFRLLVASLRRGGRLAVALDARGLRSGPRTIARSVRWTIADSLAILVCLGVLALAIALRW